MTNAESRLERHTVAPGIDLAVRRWSPPRGSQGRRFLLVHGLASNARMWDGVAAHLVGLGHEVAAVDQRGHGQSAKPDDGYDFTTVTDDLVALIGSLGWTATGDAAPVVAGQSWGANVVLELSWRCPDLLAAAVLVDGGTIDLSTKFPTWEACRKALAPPRTAGTPYEQIEGWMRDAHLDWPESGIQGSLACFERRADGTAAPWLTFERHMAILAALYGHRPAERYPDIGVPVTFLTADTSRSDVMGGASWTADKRRDVDAALGLLPRGRAEWMVGDHDLHAQHPSEVAGILLAAAADADADRADPPSAGGAA